MLFKTIALVILLVEITIADVLVNDDNWINRLLEKNKDKLEKYAKNEKHVDVQAVSLDRKNWSYDSVLALLKLIKESKTSEPVLHKLRRGIKNSMTKFRGQDESYEDDHDSMETVIRIKDHAQLQLPHSEIRLHHVLDILRPHDPDNSEEIGIHPPIPTVGRLPGSDFDHAIKLNITIQTKKGWS